MDAIGPGDWVECVHAGEFQGNVSRGRLVQGAIYRVRAIGLTGSGCLGVALVEVRDPITDRYNGFWRIGRFRPIYRPKSEIIEALKQPAPSVKVDA